jgi:hypothetical protein
MTPTPYKHYEAMSNYRRDDLAADMIQLLSTTPSLEDATMSLQVLWTASHINPHMIDVVQLFLKFVEEGPQDSVGYLLKHIWIDTYLIHKRKLDAEAAAFQEAELAFAVKEEAKQEEAKAREEAEKETAEAEDAEDEKDNTEDTSN